MYAHNGTRQLVTLVDEYTRTQSRYTLVTLVRTQLCVLGRTTETVRVSNILVLFFF